MRTNPKFRIYSLKTRLIFTASVVTILAMMLAGLLTSQILKQEIELATFREISATLSTCKIFFRNQLNIMSAKARDMANSNTTRTTLKLSVLPQLNDHLKYLRQYHQLDFIAVAGLDGSLIAADTEIGTQEKQLFGSHPLFVRALRGENPASFIVTNSCNLVTPSSAKGEKVLVLGARPRSKSERKPTAS